MKNLVLIALTAVLGACSTLHTPDTARLEGEVYYLQRSALPPGATLSVSLQDVSRADAPATTLARYDSAVSTQVPLPFHLQYDPAQVTPGHSYAVSARIEAAGRLLFISTERHSVNLQGGDQPPLRIRVNPALP